MAHPPCSPAGVRNGRGSGEAILQGTVFGARSRAWPLNCSKSDKIVRGFAGCLSIEAGAFSTRNGPGSRTPWHVMKRAEVRPS